MSKVKEEHPDRSWEKEHWSKRFRREKSDGKEGKGDG